MFELLYPEGISPILPYPTFDKSMRGEEMLPVVELNGIVKGQATRHDCHSMPELLHPVVHLYIIDREGRVFLQKRSDRKDTWPGRWDTSVGGHVSYGETIHEALFREAEEELGFTQFNPVFVSDSVYSCEHETEVVVTFAAIGSFQIKACNEEVSEGRFWTGKEIEDNLGKDVFTPNFETEYKRISSKLEALL